MNSVAQLKKAAAEAWDTTHDYYRAVAVLIAAGWSDTGAARAVAELEREGREHRAVAA